MLLKYTKIVSTVMQYEQNMGRGRDRWITCHVLTNTCVLIAAIKHEKNNKCVRRSI